MKITKNELPNPEETLFPKNYLDIRELRKDSFVREVRSQFEDLINNRDTMERDILKFINDNKYWLIIGLLQKNFSIDNYGAGHHFTYVFKEFPLGSSYRADYLIVGKGSGGYQFVFVELESPYRRGNNKPTKGTGELGGVFRDGIKQIKEWKRWLDKYYSNLSSIFKAKKNKTMQLPNDFLEYDPTRMHFVVVAGRRKDFTDLTYSERRDAAQDNIPKILLHYDNLIDNLRKEHNSY